MRIEYALECEKCGKEYTKFCTYREFSEYLAKRPESPCCRGSVLKKKWTFAAGIFKGDGFTKGSCS